MSHGDIVFCPSKVGSPRFYKIEGVYLGAVGQEGYVELRSLTERPGHIGPKDAGPTTFVPEPLLRHFTIYTPGIGQAHIPKDHPLMRAWERWKTFPEFANTFKWAAHEEHREGSLWEAFQRGYHAAIAEAERAEWEKDAHMDCYQYGNVPAQPKGADDDKAE